MQDGPATAGPRARLWLGTVLALVLGVAPVGAADWPQWLGPRRDGSTPEKIQPWQTEPTVVWKEPVGAGFSMPVIARGRVFVHAWVKDKEQEEVIALDARTGGRLWHDVYDRVSYQGVVGNGPRATPTVAGNRVYTFGITGVLSCYQADTGQRLWQTDVYKALQATLPTFGVCCSPLVLGNRVLVSVGGKGSCLAAFDTDKGELQWRGFDEPASTASPILFAAPGRRRGGLPDVVFMTSLRLLAVNPLDGSLNWEYPLVFQPAGASPTPIVSGDRIITSTITNGTVAIRMATQGDRLMPERDWQNKDLTGYFSTGVVVGPDQLYLVTNVTKPLPIASLQCVDRKTGKELWKKGNIGFFHAGLLRTGDDRLLVLDDTGTLRLVEPSRQGYRELAHAKVCQGTFVNPALADGLLYVRDSTHVICLRPHS
jgi:outer membrane protein assembly factor BamB